MKNNNRIQIIVSCKDYIRDYECVKSMGTIKHKLPMINAYVVEINENKMNEIISNDGVLAYEYDAYITAQMNRASEIIELKWAHDRDIYGENIGVAVVDTGIWPHEDFISDKNRVVGFCDIINNEKKPYDDNGHGTHVACSISQIPVSTYNSTFFRYI